MAVNAGQVGVPRHKPRRRVLGRAEPQPQACSAPRPSWRRAISRRLPGIPAARWRPERVLAAVTSRSECLAVALTVALVAFDGPIVLLVPLVLLEFGGRRNRAVAADRAPAVTRPLPGGARRSQRRRGHGRRAGHVRGTSRERRAAGSRRSSGRVPWRPRDLRAGRRFDRRHARAPDAARSGALGPQGARRRSSGRACGIEGRR